MTAALALPATRTVHVRCARCRTIDHVTVDTADAERGRLPLAFCRVCVEPCTDLRPLGFEADVHLDCDHAGCAGCRWTGWQQDVPLCSRCARREVSVHRHGESLCATCDAARASERTRRAARR